MARHRKKLEGEDAAAMNAKAAGGVEGAEEGGVSIPPAVVNDPNVGRLETTIPSVLSLVPRATAETSELAEAEQYRITWAPEKVGYRGQVVSFYVGKIVTPSTYDIPALRRAGVRLEAVTP